MYTGEGTASVGGKRRRHPGEGEEVELLNYMLYYIYMYIFLDLQKFVSYQTLLFDKTAARCCSQVEILKSHPASYESGCMKSFTNSLHMCIYIHIRIKIYSAAVVLQPNRNAQMPASYETGWMNSCKKKWIDDMGEAAGRGSFKDSAADAWGKISFSFEYWL